MCVYICVCVCACVCVCVHACTCACLCVCMHFALVWMCVGGEEGGGMLVLMCTFGDTAFVVRCRVYKYRCCLLSDVFVVENIRM